MDSDLNEKHSKKIKLLNICLEITSKDRLGVGWLNGSFITSTGRGAARAEVAQGTPAQSHISPSILVCEEDRSLSP